MLRVAFDRLQRTLLRAWYLRRHGGIWGLKDHLAAEPSPDRRMVQIYDAHLGRFGSWIGYDSRFLGVPCFPHGFYGVFISGGATIGRNVVIFQQVTIGSNSLRDSSRPGSPTIGNNVYIGAGAKIIGAVNIGDNCRVGANAVVYEDMPPHSVAVQAPTRIIQKKDLDNRYFSRRDGQWVFFLDGRWVRETETP